MLEKGSMALRKYVPSGDAPSTSMKPLRFVTKVHGSAASADPLTRQKSRPVDVDLKEVYFLIMHFLSTGPCQRTFGQLWNELLEHQLLPRRYHAWYSRSGERNLDENDDGISFPLSYNKLVERYPHIEKDHLIKLLKQLITTTSPSHGINGGHVPTAADVPTLLGSGSFSLLNDGDKGSNKIKRPSPHMRWPHKQADQVHGLSLREIGGGFTRHHRSPSIRAACYAIAKPSTMVQKMQNIKRIRGHRNAVYCATFDRSGRYVITGSDDRLVKIWSMETAYCLASCRGHEGDITDLAVSSNNALVASSSNDCVIRVWRLPDGLPISVLRGHTGAVTAIAFSPRPSAVYQLLSSSDDGTCRIWDARNSQFCPRVYVPRPPDPTAGRNGAVVPGAVPQNHQIFCCAFNANGTVFVTGSSDTLARVYNAFKPNKDEPDQPNYEIDVLAGHENDVNYVQFSGCAVASRFSMSDTKEETSSKFKNSWFSHDNIVTCSRDGSAIIWIPKSRRSHSKVGRWTRAYHLKVPPPPMPPQPPKGGPRQRILPTPRGVNMIIWSLDNRFVLAAIMDCRICVWNASDGSLVHSLTGHSNSTYVLDVHPLDPRIAMSAGYDGKIIVWDIWEGKPMRIYEISRFKLVDGKFSPDGTSIILSDDVGQLYLLSTGEGESQRDAKYDQFFLGDYRPLIQDTFGNVLDQETQLAPYRRNMQDLLCDSAMTPYEEPYQSMYQKRRLGALGIEWRPSSLRLAVGPDFSLDQDIPMLPLADLDALVEPLPEFVDAMDWEPEVEVVVSDDNDSEYDVAEEYSSGGMKGSPEFNSSDDPECGDEDSEADDSNLDHVRRSKRRKEKAEVEIMTASGRHVKRRNLDEYGGDASRSNRSRKQKHGQNKKSSKTKASRPRRRAARNALNLFSRITGASTDGEDEYGSECDLSESESARQESTNESDESDQSLQNDQIKHSKGKGLARVETEGMDEQRNLPSHALADAGKRKRLILKLPIRDPNKHIPPEILEDKSDSRVYSVVKQVKGDNSDRGEPSREANYNSTLMRGKEQLVKDECHMHLIEGYANGKIKWGGVRARSSKRPRLAEALASIPYAESTSHFDGNDGAENKANGTIKAEENILELQDVGPSEHKPSTSLQVNNDISHAFDGESLKEVCITSEDRMTPSIPEYGSGHLDEVKDSRPISMMTSDRALLDPACASEQVCGTSVDGSGDDPRNAWEHLHGTEQNQISDAPAPDSSNIVSLDNGHHELPTEKNVNSGSTLQSLSNIHSNGNKPYAVYRRSKLTKGKTNVEGDVCRVGESTSNTNNLSASAGLHLQEDSPNGFTRPEEVKFRLSSPITENNVLASSQGNEEDALPDSQGDSPSTTELPHDDWASSSKATVGLRSTRNRRSTFHLRDNSPVDRRKSSQTSRKMSWLLLTSHEEGPRYIPQQGDSVVYLRQGHEEFINQCGSREMGPWQQMKANIRAVEFCEVESLEYSIWAGSGECCCKMTLRFVDPSSFVFRKSFKLTLPEVVGLPDFLVERSRYEAATQRNWTTRDKCKVWWKNEGEENGSWWPGRILSVKPKSSEFPDSPWERFTIQYKSDPPEIYPHSPWELFDADTQWEQPCIDDECRNKLLSAISKLEQSGNKAQDRYGIQKLRQATQKNSFLNRFPVPVTLDVIQARLENSYYRSLEAVKHDIMVMLQNAESHCGKNQELSTKIRRLSDWFAKTLSSL